jgi:hypothetical protein
LPAPPAGATLPRDVPQNQSGVSLGVIVDEKRTTDEGLRIAKVARDSPADRAGLRSGDILVSIAGVEIKELALFDELLAAFSPQDQVQVEFLRGNKLRKSTVSFGGDAIAPHEFPSELSAEFSADPLAAPLPPDLPAYDDAGDSSGSTGSGARSILRDSRRSSRSKRDESTTVEQPPVFPSDNLLPPVTGSSVRRQAGKSILQRPDPVAPEDTESLEIELLSPDGD